MRVICGILQSFVTEMARGHDYMHHQYINVPKHSSQRQSSRIYGKLGALEMHSTRSSGAPVAHCWTEGLSSAKRT